MSLLENMTKLVKSSEDREFCSEAISTINQLLAEGRIVNFIAPFRVSGNWVNDSRGKGVCEMGESREALKDIAAALNTFVKVKEGVTSGAAPAQNTFSKELFNKGFRLMNKDGEIGHKAAGKPFEFSAEYRKTAAENEYSEGDINRMEEKYNDSGYVENAIMKSVKKLPGRGGMHEMYGMWMVPMQDVAEGLVGDVVVHNYTKMPIDLKPGQAQIHGWGPNEQPIYRVKGQDGKEVITSNKKKMMMIAQGQGVAEGLEDENSIWNQYGHYTKQDLMKEFPNITPQDAQSIVNYAEYGWSTHSDAQKFRNEVVKRIKMAMGQQGVAEGSLASRYSDDPTHPSFSAGAAPQKDPADSLAGILALRKSDPARAFRALQDYGFRNPKDPIIDAASKAGSDVKKQMLQKMGITNPKPWDIPPEITQAMHDAMFDYIEKNLPKKNGMKESTLEKNQSLLKSLVCLVKESPITEMDDARTGEDLEVGDVVEIAGNVEHQGMTGEIVRFGEGKRFVVVNLYNGGVYSFHSSDVIEADLSHEHDDDEDEENTFWVAFHDEDEGNTWIGKVSREHSTKWRELPHKGKPDYRWGSSYMGYLEPHQVMGWIDKDYSRGMEIKGPFMSAEEAEEYAEQNFGSINEEKEVCKQCGMEDCTCKPGQCNCTPKPGYPKK